MQCRLENPNRITSISQSLFIIQPLLRSHVLYNYVSGFDSLFITDDVQV